MHSALQQGKKQYLDNSDNTISPFANFMVPTTNFSRKTVTWLQFCNDAPSLFLSSRPQIKDARLRMTFLAYSISSTNVVQWFKKNCYYSMQKMCGLVHGENQTNKQKSNNTHAVATAPRPPLLIRVGDNAVLKLPSSTSLDDQKTSSYVLVVII